MQQVKVFVSLESESSSLERDINKWLAESGARVLSIFGNIAPQTQKSADRMSSGGFGASDVMIVVLYEK